MGAIPDPASRHRIRYGPGPQGAGCAVDADPVTPESPRVTGEHARDHRGDPGHRGVGQVVVGLRFVDFTDRYPLEDWNGL